MKFSHFLIFSLSNLSFTLELKLLLLAKFNFKQLILGKN